jgi:hypothetical protein
MGNCIIMRSFIICKLHFYYDDQIKGIGTGHVALMGQMRSTYNILVGKPEGKRPPGRQAKM